MAEKQKYGALDAFRIVAALMVVAIHTSPLASYSAEADFFMTRVISRVAVPFFLMVSGQFAMKSEESVIHFCQKTITLYGIAMLIYLPLGIYAGYYRNFSPGILARMLFFDGTFYHLWYFPACVTGILTACALERLHGKAMPLIIAGILYLIGLAGDSYYGLTARVPALESIYRHAFHIFSYTRNGMFMAPLFLLIGWRLSEMKRLPGRGVCLAGMGVSFLLMTSEAFLLRNAQLMRHDSMYFFLPPTVGFLYILLLQFPRPAQSALRDFSMWVYLLHPAMIVAVRTAARLLHLTFFLVDDSLIHYFAVSALSFAAAFLIVLRGRGRGRTGRAWIELDITALKENVKILRALLPQTCRLMPALKANAYGHGAVPIARALRRMGVDAFCVATVQEGVELRKHGIWGEILVLGYTHPDDFPVLRRWRLTQTVIDFQYANLLNACGRKMRVHVAVDTGMHRLGVSSEDAEALHAVGRMKNLVITGVFTHFCVSDEESAEGKAYTLGQAEAFYRAVEPLRSREKRRPKLHMLASYGVLRYPEFAEDYARVGIALYGVLSNSVDCIRYGQKLRPVLSLKARVATVRTLHRGQAAGYGLTCTAEKEMKLATLSIGYADGVPRSLSGGKGYVLIHGVKAPIVGRICMDQMLVDASDIQKIHQGDEAVLIGKSGAEQIAVTDWADACDTITNEILSRLGARLDRTLKRRGD